MVTMSRGTAGGRMRKLSVTTEEAPPGFELDPDLIEPLPKRGGVAEKTSSVLVKAVMFPMPPSANVYWRTRVLKMKNPSFKQLRMNGGYMAMTYLSKDAQAYKETVADRVRSKNLNFMSKEILHVSVLVCPATNRQMDIDNRIKPLFDALAGAGVFENDSQIYKFDVERGQVVKGGRVVVTIREIVPDVAGALSRSGWTGK